MIITMKEITFSKKGKTTKIINTLEDAETKYILNYLHSLSYADFLNYFVFQEEFAETYVVKKDNYNFVYQNEIINQELMDSLINNYNLKRGIEFFDTHVKVNKMRDEIRYETNGKEYVFYYNDESQDYLLFFEYIVWLFIENKISLLYFNYCDKKIMKFGQIHKYLKKEYEEFVKNNRKQMLKLL